jgi:hypothetical protein
MKMSKQGSNMSRKSSFHAFMEVATSMRKQRSKQASDIDSNNYSSHKNQSSCNLGPGPVSKVINNWDIEQPTNSQCSFQGDK